MEFLAEFCDIIDSYGGRDKVNLVIRCKRKCQGKKKGTSFCFYKATSWKQVLFCAWQIAKTMRYVQSEVEDNKTK